MTIILLIIIWEIWTLWALVFHEEFFFAVYSICTFYLRVLCGWVCYLSFSQTSVITMTTHDGEILKQVFIGEGNEK